MSQILRFDCHASGDCMQGFSTAVRNGG